MTASKAVLNVSKRPATLSTATMHPKPRNETKRRKNKTKRREKQTEKKSGHYPKQKFGPERSVIDFFFGGNRVSEMMFWH